MVIFTGQNEQLVNGAHGKVKNDKIVSSNVLVKNWSVLDLIAVVL